MNSLCSTSLRSPLVSGFAVFALAVSFVAGADDAQDPSVDGITGASPESGQRHFSNGFAGGDGAAAMFDRFGAELGLTAQQKTDLQIITTDYGERLRDIAVLGRNTARELLAMEPDDPDYQQKTDEASALAATSAAETVILLAEMRGKIHAVLTETQRELLRQKIEARRQEFKERKQRHDSHHRPMEESIG